MDVVSQQTARAALRPSRKAVDLVSDENLKQLNRDNDEALSGEEITRKTFKPNAVRSFSTVIVPSFRPLRVVAHPHLFAGEKAEAGNSVPCPGLGGGRRDVGD